MSVVFWTDSTRVRKHDHEFSSTRADSRVSWRESNEEHEEHNDFRTLDSHAKFIITTDVAMSETIKVKN